VATTEVLSDGTVKITRHDSQVREHFALKFEDGHTEGRFASREEAAGASATLDVWSTVVGYKTFTDTTTVQEIRVYGKNAS
jgi:hypothetical protein